MSDVFGDMSSANNGDVALSNDTSNAAPESILISPSNVNLATSSIPVSSSSTSILIPSEATLSTGESESPLDVIPSTAASEIEGMNNNASVNGTQEETSVAIDASSSQFILDASQTIELNGEKHKFLQQLQDPESGELLVVLESESGEHVLLPLSSFTDGVDIAPAEAPESESILPEANAEATAATTTATTIDGSIVYQASTDEACLLNIQQENLQPTGTDEALSENAAKEISTPITTAVLPVTIDNENGATDESIETFVPTNVSSTDGTESFVIMSSADGTTDQINLAQVIGPSESSGQTYLIETPEGLVACSSAAVEDTKGVTETLEPVSPIQSTELTNAASSAEYVTESELTTSTEEAILQAVTQSGNIADGQIIHAVQGSQTLAYQIAATESGIQLIPMGPVNTTDATTATTTTSSSTTTTSNANNIPATPSKAANRSKASNNTSTLLSDSQASTKKGKQSVTKNTKNSNTTTTRTPEYMQHSSTNSKQNSKLISSSLFTPTNSSSSLIGDALGPSQLASSHRTYSRKNIVWVNPENKSSSSSSPSTNESSKVTTCNTITSSSTTVTGSSTPVSKSVTFASKSSNSSVDTVTRKISPATSKSSPVTVSPRKNEIDVINKRSSPVKNIQVEQSPCKVTKAPSSPRKSPVKSTERVYQTISLSSNVTIIPAASATVTSSSSSSLVTPSTTIVTTPGKGNVNNEITCESSSKNNKNSSIILEVIGVDFDSESNNDSSSKTITLEHEQQVVTSVELIQPVKRKRGRPPKRSVDQTPTPGKSIQVAAAAAAATATATPTPSVTVTTVTAKATPATANSTPCGTKTASVTITKVEPVDIAPTKRAKVTPETPKPLVEEVTSGGRESRRTRRTPRRYASDDESSSEVEKGEKYSSLDPTTETNKEISIPSTVEHKPSSNCETGQDSTIERVTDDQVSLEITTSSTLEADDDDDTLGNNANVSTDESSLTTTTTTTTTSADTATTTVDEIGSVGSSKASESETTSGNVGENMDCETSGDNSSNNQVTEIKTDQVESVVKEDQVKSDRKTRKSVGFKDLTDDTDSSTFTTSENDKNTSCTISTRKRVQITDSNGSDTSTPVCKKSPILSEMKLTPILKTKSKYSPIVAKGKRLDAAIVCSFSPTDPETIQSTLRESITSLADTRSSVEKYDLSATDCSFHIRHQPSASLYKPGSDSNYICQVCGYTTSRINNLVFHHKELCSVVKKLCRSLWEHEIRKQTKSPSSSSTSYFSHQNASASSPSSSSPLHADGASKDDDDEEDENDDITDSTEFSQLAV